VTRRRRAPAAARSCALFLASPLRGLPRVIQFSSDLFGGGKNSLRFRLPIYKCSIVRLRCATKRVFQGDYCYTSQL
jgi:hypothetical protein